MSKFVKGHKKLGGKMAGTPNKFTKTVKETVLLIFNEIQSDPKVNLRAFAKKYPRDFYQIAAKLIPTEINARVNKVTLQIVRTNSTEAENAASESAEDIK